MNKSQKWFEVTAKTIADACSTDEQMVRRDKREGLLRTDSLGGIVDYIMMRRWRKKLEDERAKTN